MKKTLFVFFAASWMLTTEAQTLKTPSLSTSQQVKQEFGLGSIELNYSRPNIKGRKVFGDLVPYGAIWRTGANSATTITFSDDVIIGDKKVPAGKYGLLTIPGASNWTIIISKQTDVTSPAAYKQDMDLVRLDVRPESLPMTIESFMIVFDYIKANELDLLILWDRTAVRLPIKQDIDTKVMAQIDNLMNKDNRPYYNAAMYYLENNKDLNKAAAWLDKAVEQSPNAYWVWYQKARCLALLGKKADAKAASDKSLQLATQAKNGDYVTLNEKLQAGLK